MLALILEEIANERRRQDEQWGTEFDDKNTPSDWASYITAYAARTAPMDRTPDLKERRIRLIKIAALAVVAIQTQDRVGIVPRHFDDQPGMDVDLAHAIIDMDDHGTSESLGPSTMPRADAWEALVLKAEAATGRKSNY